jgi:hypothetical protein
MALFFFVVGLEVKRELVTGELREPRRASLPVLAALGGIVVPAAIFLALNLGGVGARGWGIPMATDIAFAVGVLAVLGSRVPAGAKLFLLTLAIVDDIVAITVIAVSCPGFEPAHVVRDGQRRAPNPKIDGEWAGGSTRRSAAEPGPSRSIGAGQAVGCRVTV